MSEKLKKYTFLKQLEQGYIRIPRIQRGYAQGRQTKKVDDIRKTFLHTLFQVIKGKRPYTELDFVYGSMNGGAFEPLDGQQRLTTLFLIHWMLGVNLTRKENEKRSVFTYASCPTSEDFSNALVTHDAISLISEALTKRNKAKENKDAKEEDKTCTPSKLIEKRDWFHWEWKFDPSISSMLVMIDSIFSEIICEDNWNDKIAEYRNNLNNITFNGLNLGDFGLSNELFIKMNARGKQLSDFDKVKSTLEEEIQIQQTEKDLDDKYLATQAIESEWRTLMDGKWSDYFWHTYARNVIATSTDVDDEEHKRICLAAAKDCEVQFKKLLIRLIQLQLHSRMPVSDTLREACYRRNANEIDNLLVAYSDSLLSFRNQDSKIAGATETMIDFAALIKQINSLFVDEEDGTVIDVFRNLPGDTHINCNDINLMQSFLEDTLSNDVALTFFAALQFLNLYPCTDNDEWRGNFRRWIKSLRNILANDNNTQRIDKRWRYENAMKAIMEMSNDLRVFGADNNISANDPDFVNRFFGSIKQKTYVGIDNQSLREESDKASLVLSVDVWHQIIETAEQDSYLWGQIRALLEWSEGDIDRFKNYYDKLAQLLGLIHLDPNRYYIAALKFEPNVWSASNRLYQLNYDRDNSFKRYLRDYDKDLGTNAPLIKRMIDSWIETADTLSAWEYLETIITDDTRNTPIWLECIIRQPSILDYSYHKRLYEEKGHVILAQLKTKDSHCIDPILKYLQILASEHQKDNKILFDDSKSTPPHRITYNSDAGSYILKWGEQTGMYKLIDPNGQSQELSASDAVEQFSNLLNI